MTALQLFLLFGAGLIAGVINTVAGGGSLLTLPALIFSGIPSVEANATNRLGILSQTLVSTPQMLKASEPATSTYLKALLPLSLMGGAIGTWIASQLTGLQFDRALAVCMLLMLILVFKKNTFVDGNAESFTDLSLKRKAALLASFFALGFYAGFIQAGMGMVTLMVLSLLTKMTLVQANTLKTVMIMVITILALAMFMILGIKIHLFAGLVLSGGTMIGAQLGTKLALGSKGEKIIRWALIGMTLVSAVKLFLGW